MKILIALPLLFVVAARKSTAPPKCQVDPALFCSPYQYLFQRMEDDTRSELAAIPDNELSKLHHEFGMTVRNLFNLWGDNEITRYLRDRGIEHPDLMSTPVISGYIRFIRGEQVDMDLLIEQYLTGSGPFTPSDSGHG